MRRRSLSTLSALATAAVLAAVPSAARAQIVANGSFESPVVTDSRGYAYNPTGGSWSFIGGSGIVAGTPTPFNTPSAAPDGQQVAFLQAASDRVPSRISQSITLSSSGTFRLTFFDAGRNNPYYTGNTTFDVLLGNTVLATTSTVTGQPYTPQSVEFTAAAGTYDLAFAFNPSQPAGDNTAFLDNVQVTQLTSTPEPSTWALMGAGLLSLGAAVRRRRSANA